MRQLASQASGAIGDGNPYPVLSAWIPKSSWLNTKRMLFRGTIKFTIPGGILPLTYNVAEQITISQGLPAVLNSPAPFTPVPGTFVTTRLLEVIRLDPYLIADDQAYAYAVNFMNRFNAPSGAGLLQNTPPPYDFIQEIRIDLTMTMDNTIPGATIDALWCEGFLEQGTNLGKLP